MPDGEILCKAKRLDNGEWVEGYYVHNAAGQHMMVGGCHDKSYIMTEVDPSTVCQYTGLTDKHSTWIFEGDICRVGNLTYQVVFQYSQWWFSIVTPSVYCCPYFDSHCGKYCEVIGNRWDNPELLPPTPGEEDAN